jgi:mycothiol synthase
LGSEKPLSNRVIEEPTVRLPLTPGYTIRSPRPADVNDVQALTAASDLAEFGEAEGYSIEELEDEWAAIDLDRDAWLVIAPDGSIAGYAYIRDRQHVRLDVEGYVHPGHYGNAIGTTLIELSEARAREHLPLAPPNARVMLHNWISGTNPNACALLERAGYTPVRYFLRMEMDLDGAVPSASLPDGITVRTFESDDADAQTFHSMFEEAMSDHWGHVPVPFDEWKQRRMGSSFDPNLWFVASEGNEPAGFALCNRSGEIGWIDTLGVRRPWRRRGLGMALLWHAQSAFRQHGLKRMALGVDTANPTGATRLYQRAGMHMAQQHATYGKELRAGEDAHDAAVRQAQSS